MKKYLYHAGQYLDKHILGVPRFPLTLNLPLILTKKSPRFIVTICLKVAGKSPVLR